MTFWAKSRLSWCFTSQVQLGRVIWAVLLWVQCANPKIYITSVMNFFKQLSLNLAVCCAGFEHVDDDDFFSAFALCRLPDWDLSSHGNCYIFWQELACNTSNLWAVPEKLSRVFFQSDVSSHLLRPDTTTLSPLGSRSVQQTVYRDLAKSVSTFSISFIT